MYKAMKNLPTFLLCSLLLLSAQTAYSDSVTLHNPNAILISPKEAKALGFLASIPGSVALDAEVSMIVAFPKEVEGAQIDNVVARLFHNELSISTHTVSVGEGKSGNKRAWVNLNRAVVTRVEMFFHSGHKKYVVSIEPKNI